MFQEIEFFNFKIVKNWKKFKKTYTNDEEVKQSIIKKMREINEFYENRDKNNLLLEFLGFTPIMYWCAFKRVVPLDHPQYNPKVDITNHTTIPLFNELKELYNSYDN